MREPIGKLASEWTIVHGLSIHARVSVNPVPAEAPAIIMVHGLVVSSRYMIPTALQLAPYYHIYALDLPGFGKSDKPSHVLNITELADFLADWMQAIGLKQATLLGNSLGCQVIANFALRHPEHISQIILLGPTTDPRARTAYQLMVRWLLNATREPLSLFPIVIRDYPGRRLSPLCVDISVYASRPDRKASSSCIQTQGWWYAARMIPLCHNVGLRRQHNYCQTANWS